MSFSDIRDQGVASRLLRNALERERIPNAMLFWGPSGVGKRLAALEFAKAISCPEADTDACDACLSCRKIQHDNHPDVLRVVPLKKSRTIDVATIDNIIEMAYLRPFEGEWRIFIIQEADRMRPPAQNHLLKTLEEPPGRSLFILLSEQPQLLLPTIRSRCQMLRFRSLSPATVKHLLMRERTITDESASSIASVSQGQMSRAFDLVDSDKRSVVFDVIARLSSGEDPLAVSVDFAKYLSSQKVQLEAGVKESIAAGPINELSKEDREQIKEQQSALAGALGRRAIMELLYLMETWYRDTLVYSATGDASRVLNQDQLALLEGAEVTRSAEKIGAIAKARLYLERFLNEERVFRDLFFALAS